MAESKPIYADADAIDDVLAEAESRAGKQRDACRHMGDIVGEGRALAELAACRAYRFGRLGQVPPEWAAMHERSVFLAAQRCDREGYEQYLALKARFEPNPS